MSGWTRTPARLDAHNPGIPRPIHGADRDRAGSPVLVLRFLDRQQRVWTRIVEEHEIREHLDGAVGNVPGDEWILETAVLKAQDKPTVLGGFCLDVTDAGDALLHRFQHAIEAVPMVFIEELSNLGYVVPTHGKVFGVACFHAGPSIADVEVGNVPVLDERAELGHHPELFELAKPLDRKHGRIIKLVFLAFLFDALLAVCRFVRDRPAATTRKIHKVPGFAVLASPKFQNLPLDHGTAFFTGNVQLVGGQPATALAEFDGDADGPGFSSGYQFPESPTTVMRGSWVSLAFRNSR